MVYNFEALSDRLNVNVSDVRKDLPIEIFPIAGEMFVYLNSCPQNYVNFFKYLLDEQPLTDTISTIQNAIKTFHKERFRQVSEKVMKKLANMLEFKYFNHNNIPKWSKDINSVPGITFFALFTDNPTFGAKNVIANCQAHKV